MAPRTYSQINNSVLRSRKMIGLDHRARWAWLAAHLRADFLGLVEYPISLWSADSEIEAADMSGLVEGLVNVGLIDWIPDHDMVRVIGFIKQRPPENASVAKRLCHDLIDMLYDADTNLEAMLLETSAELAVSSITRSLRWPTDRKRFRDEMGEFLRGIAKDFGDVFQDALLEELEGSARPTRNEIEALLPTLSLHRQNTMPTPSPHPADTQDVDETRHRQDENKNQNENLDSANSNFGNDTQPNLKVSRVGSAEKGEELQRPLPETIAAARRMGSIQ